MAELNSLGMSGLISLPKYKERGEWLEERHGRITATKIWALLGGLGFVQFLEMLSDCGSAHVVAELIAAKLFKRRRSPPEDSLPLVWGNECEALARREWVRLVTAVYPILNVQEGGWHYYPDDTRLAATPDAYLWSDVEPSPITLIEFKCCWTRPPPKTRAEIPPQYLFQVQHQMVVTGATAALLVYYQTLWNEEPVPEMPFERPIRLVQFWVDAWCHEQQSEYVQWLQRIRDSPPVKTQEAFARALTPNRQRLLDWAYLSVRGYDADLKQSLDSGRIHRGSSLALLSDRYALGSPVAVANTQRQRQAAIARVLCTLAQDQGTASPVPSAQCDTCSEDAAPGHGVSNADSRDD